MGAFFYGETNMFERSEEMRFEIVKLLLNHFEMVTSNEKKKFIEEVLEEARKVEGYLLEDEEASS